MENINQTKPNILYFIFLSALRFSHKYYIRSSNLQRCLWGAISIEIQVSMPYLRYYSAQHAKNPALKIKAHVRRVKFMITF